MLSSIGYQLQVPLWSMCGDRLDDFQTRSGFLITPVVFFGPSEPALCPAPTEVHAAYVVPLSVLEAPGVPTIRKSATSEHPLIAGHNDLGADGSAALLNA